MVTRILPALCDIRLFKSPYASEFCFIGARVSGALVSHLKAPLYVMGKGQTEKQAQIRLCGEAIERLSIQAEGANTVWKGQDPLGGHDQTVSPKDYFGTSGRLQTHGCACHNLLGTANLVAVAELWERRAVQLWWAGACTLRPLTAEHPLHADLTAHADLLRGKPVEWRETVFCLIEGDLPIDVAVALSWDKAGGQMAIGFAAGCSGRKPLFQRAFEELLSVELEVADLFRAHLDGDLIQPDSNRHKVAERQVALQARLPDELANARPLTPRSGSTETNLDTVLKSSEKLGARVLLVDMTHQSIGVPTVRAIFENPKLSPFAEISENTVLPV